MPFAAHSAYAARFFASARFVAKANVDLARKAASPSTFDEGSGWAEASWAGVGDCGIVARRGGRQEINRCTMSLEIFEHISGRVLSLELVV